MRASSLALLGLLLLPAASAGMGPYGDDGWPVNVDGQSVAPPGAPAIPLTAEPLNQVAGTTLYPYWPLLTLEMQRLSADHPDKVRLTSAGTSTLGLDLWMLEIADFDRIEAGEGTPLGDREVVWVDGGTHSNEYSGVYFALAVAQFLLDSYDTNDTARWIVENRHTWIMPMVNPDGSNAMGRLNANLVNINRNYPVVWDGQGHDPLLNNRGPHPASEVETQINIAWFNKTHPDYYASVHCCGNLWLYPYGEEGVDPPDQFMLQRVCDEAFPGVRDECGPIWSTIYPASGSSVDTAYEYTGAVAFGYEMSGRGAVAIWGQPLTFEDVFVQEHESWAGLLHAFLNVHLYGAYPAVEDITVDGGAVHVTVRNVGYGNLTAGMVHVDGNVVDMEPLPVGATATYTLPLDDVEEHTLVVHYQKRAMQTPMGELRMTFGADGQPLSDTQDAPVPPLVALVVLLGAAVQLSRRRAA